MAGSGAKQPGDVFDLKRLTQLIELMKEHGLTEVDLQQEKQKIRLSRGSTGEPVAMSTALPTLPAPAPAAKEDSLAADEPHIVTITSPMVGTFYIRPNPETEPFVKVGDRVGPDTIVCMIEAMKVFNEIPAEVSGQIISVLVDTDELVDFGKPLFKVDTKK